MSDSGPNRASQRSKGFFGSVRNWTWGAAGISLATAALVMWVRSEQVESVDASRHLLSLVREARSDLAHGLLDLTLASEPNAPVRHEEGLAKLDQAVATLEEEQTAAAQVTGLPLDPELSTALTASAETLRNELRTYRDSGPEGRAQRVLPLRLAFHEVDRLAQRVDREGKEGLESLVGNMDRQFAILMAGAMLLLLSMYLGLFHALRKRSAVEKELSESRERFRALVETAYDWVWEVDTLGRYTYVSPKSESLLGFMPAEVLGHTPFDYMPEAEARRVKALFDELVWRRKPFSGLENVNLSKSGERVVLETSGVPIFGPDGSFLGYRGMDRDISQRKRLEEERERVLTKYRTLFDSLPLGIAVTDPEGRIIETNQVALELLGISPGDQVGLQVNSKGWKTIRTDGYPLATEEFASVRALREHRVVRNVEIGVVAPGGETSWISVTAAPSPLPDLGVVITYADITARRQAQEALLEERRLLEERVARRTEQLAQANGELSDLYDRAPCGYHSLDAEGRFVRVNDTELAWLGYTREEVLGGHEVHRCCYPGCLREVHADVPPFQGERAVR